MSESAAPLISPAMQAVLCEQFRDELNFGARDLPHGTDARWNSHSEVWKQQAISDLTFTNLLFCQAFECGSKTDPDALKAALVSLGGTVIQWIEMIDRQAGV